MKTTIDVKDRKEGDHIRRALEQPETRAFVIVIGILADLPTNRARKRVLDFVADSLDERSHAVTDEQPLPFGPQ